MFHIGVVQEHIDCFHIIEVHITHSQDMPERSCRRNLHFEKLRKIRKRCVMVHYRILNHLNLWFWKISYHTCGRAKALWKRSPVELYLLASRDPAGFSITEYVRWSPATSAPTVAPLPVQMFSRFSASSIYVLFDSIQECWQLSQVPRGAVLQPMYSIAAGRRVFAILFCLVCATFLISYSEGWFLYFVYCCAIHDVLRRRTMFFEISIFIVLVLCIVRGGPSDWTQKQSCSDGNSLHRSEDEMPESLENVESEAREI